MPLLAALRRRAGAAQVLRLRRSLTCSMHTTQRRATTTVPPSTRDVTVPALVLGARLKAPPLGLVPDQWRRPKRPFWDGTATNLADLRALGREEQLEELEERLLLLPRTPRAAGAAPS